MNDSAKLNGCEGDGADVVRTVSALNVTAAPPPPSAHDVPIARSADAPIVVTIVENSGNLHATADATELSPPSSPPSPSEVRGLSPFHHLVYVGIVRAALVFCVVIMVDVLIAAVIESRLRMDVRISTSARAVEDQTVVGLIMFAIGTTSIALVVLMDSVSGFPVIRRLVESIPICMRGFARNARISMATTLTSPGVPTAPMAT